MWRINYKFTSIVSEKVTPVLLFTIYYLHLHYIYRALLVNYEMMYFSVHILDIAKWNVSNILLWAKNCLDKQSAKPNTVAPNDDRYMQFTPSYPQSAC